jgi:hypothetical protein
MFLLDLFARYSVFVALALEQDTRVIFSML